MNYSYNQRKFNKYYKKEISYEIDIYLNEIDKVRRNELKTNNFLDVVIQKIEFDQWHNCLYYKHYFYMNPINIIYIKPHINTYRVYNRFKSYYY